MNQIKWIKVWVTLAPVCRSQSVVGGSRASVAGMGREGVRAARGGCVSVPQHRWEGALQDDQRWRPASDQQLHGRHPAVAPALPQREWVLHSSVRLCVCVSASAAHHGALLTSDLIHSADLWPHSLRWPLTSHSHDSLTCINKSPVYLCESYQTCPGHTSPWNLKNFSNLYYHLNFYVKFWV